MLKPQKDPEVKKPDKRTIEVGGVNKKKRIKETKGGIRLKLVAPGQRKPDQDEEPRVTNRKNIGDYVDLGFAAADLGKPQEEITSAEVAAWKATKPGWDTNSIRKDAITAFQKSVTETINNNRIALGVGKKGPLYNDWLDTGGIDLDNAQYNKELFTGGPIGGVTTRFQYQEGDENSSWFANMDPEQISQIQKNLVGMKATGFKGKYIDGIWDTKTAKAFKEVLIEANYQNTTWDVIMADYAATTASSGSRGPGGGGGGRGGPIEDIEAIRQMFDSISGEVSGKNVSVIDRERLSREVLNEMTLADQNGEQYQVEERMRRKLKENDPGGAAENDALSVFNSFARMMGQGGMFGAGSAQQPITNSPATGAGGPA